MKTLIVSLFAVVVMGCVMEGKKLDEHPGSSEALAARPRLAEKASRDSGAFGEATPSALHEGGEVALACWCDAQCESRGPGCYAECDYDSGDCGCVGKCY